MATLPDKPSELILVALADMEKVQRLTDTYLIDMAEWHRANFQGRKCAVCFAGCVMAETLGAESQRTLGTCDFDEDTRSKLVALDELRQGYISGALRALGINPAEFKHFKPTRGNLFQVPISSFYNDDEGNHEGPTDNGAAFKRDMKALARQLAAVGL